MGDVGINSVQDLPEPLTEREQEILELLAGRLSNQEIASKLFLAEKTIRWYNTQIYRKLGVHNRREAIAHARKSVILAGKPAPSPLPFPRHNLPLQPTPFVGRKRDLEKVTRLLLDENVRLVTILAPGGMGKTRFSLEVAKTQLGRYSDGVFFILLEPLREASKVPLAIAEGIGFTFHGKEAPGKQLLAFLRDRSLLLVLDNFEHLLDAACYVDDIIRSAPKVRILATSRERLDLQSEIVYILHGLDFPINEKKQDLASYEAVELFMHSAQRVRPGFELQTGDLIALSRLCRLAEGMPLALELAAGWLDSLSLEHIAHELQQGIDILETDLQDLPERHRSIHATFERTWRLLAEDDQKVFMRLTVFRGGFSLDAAHAVAGASRHNLRRLSHKALIEISEGNRYSIHELLRQFGGEKLAQTSERAVILSRHSAYFADVMMTHQQDLRSDRQLEAIALIDADFENIRLAWQETLSQAAWNELLKFLDALWFYCEARTRGQEGLDLLRHAERDLRAAQMTAGTELVLGCILARLGWFYFDVGLSRESIMTCEEALRILRPYNRPEDLLAALYSLHWASGNNNQIEYTLKILHEGLSLARSVTARYWEGRFLVSLAITKYQQNDLSSALPLAEAGRSVFENLGDRWGTMRPYAVLGSIAEAQKNFQQAIDYFQTSLSISETFGHQFTIGANKTDLARIAFLVGNHTLARQYLREGLQVFWDAGYRWVSPFPLACAAQILAGQQNVIRAVEILATIDKNLISYRLTDQFARALRVDFEAKLEPDQFASAWARGQAREISEVFLELLREF